MHEQMTVMRLTIIHRPQRKEKSKQIETIIGSNVINQLFPVFVVFCLSEAKSTKN